VFINSTQYFLGVGAEVWELWIGGYQPAQKWLKERVGRKLTYEDLVHYERVVNALSGTVSMASRLEEILPSWPFGEGPSTDLTEPS
jgi:hypothetical protein